MFADQNLVPGVTAPITTTETEYAWGPAGPAYVTGVTIAAAAVDAGNTPTTTLRKGLILGKVTASGKYKQYDPTATDGTQFPVGILDQTVSLADYRSPGSTVDKNVMMRYSGLAKVGSLYGFDELARGILSPRFLWDDLRLEMPSFDVVVAKTADYTVVAADNGTLFTTLGAAGAVVFTLPALARGYRFRFFNEVNQNMTVTAPSGKLVAFNNAAATSIAFSTASNKIGAGVEIVSNSDASKYLCLPFGSGATATIS